MTSLTKYLKNSQHDDVSQNNDTFSQNCDFVSPNKEIAYENIQKLSQNYDSK